MHFFNNYVVQPTETTPILIIEPDRYTCDGRVAITFREFMNQWGCRDMTVCAPDVALPGPDWTLIDSLYDNAIVALERQEFVLEKGEPVTHREDKRPAIPARVSPELVAMASA